MEKFILLRENEKLKISQKTVTERYVTVQFSYFYFVLFRLVCASCTKFDLTHDLSILLRYLRFINVSPDVI